MTERDLHHSQPIRPIAPEPSDAERMADTTLQITFKAVDRHLTEQIKLTRELTTLTKTLISKTGNVEATLVLKTICEEVKEMRAASHVNEATLNAVCEVRDVAREIRDAIQEQSNAISQLVTLLSNGHATH